MRYVNRLFSILSLIIGLLVFASCAARSEAAARREGIERVPSRAPQSGEGENVTITVDGLQRTALIFTSSSPPPATGTPLLLVFHGHGGTAQIVARRLRLHELWPQAIVAYLQGLPGV